MQKLTFRSIGQILEKPARRKLLFLAIARIAANLLDLIGLAGIALLATAFGSLASGSAVRAPLNLPILGEFYINEYQAVFIAHGVALVFLMKSGFSIWLNLITSLTVASLEGKHSRELAETFFAPASMKNDSPQESVAEFQNRVLYSTGAITSFLNARITFMAEASLLIAMVIMFVAINPIASVSMFLFMGGVLVLLNRMINIRIVRNGQNQMKGYEASLQTSRDLFGVKREALSAGVAETWLERFTSSRYQAAQGGAVIYTLNSLPRYVVETSLILGIFAFIGGVVVFSDLPSQAVTIGVFLAGGLRLIASVLPLQAAFSQMKDGANRGQLAFEALLARQARVHTEPAPLGTSANATGLKFEDVSFRYPSSESDVLKRISFQVEPLTKVAIVGRSGAGKSTIFDLATGFLEPTSGSIKVGDHTPREILFGAPGTFGIVTQRPHLVTGSIVENVSLVDDASSNRAKVEQSLNRAGLSKFTLQPNWWEMQIKPDSGQLSGGEIQRLGLARALYRDPKILFLDEATSALDAETEAEITKVLQELKNEMTVVLIAHRLSTVMGADKIIYLDAGEIVAEGTFQELKAKVPDFARAVELMDLSDK
ncbi:MAG: ABC transporter ATP-binding protein [Actinobacteria bacterium]|nr:ABC transporter ATP-binding protein [Actinomycetota bacterium]